MSKLLVVDLTDSPSGFEQFLLSLRNSRVSVVPATRLSEVALTALAEGNEIVGFAGDASSNVALAALVAKRGGIIFACGEGPLMSWCNSVGADGPDRDAWLAVNDFGQASSMRAFQQRIGGN